MQSTPRGEQLRAPGGHARTDGDRLEITLLQERSAGTFARVYLAEARGGGGLSRVVAVKVIKEQWSESAEILTRTRDEARLLSRLQHKNILRVEALAQVDGQPAIVMEFVDGIDLQQLVEHMGKSGRRIPRRALYKILQDTTSALEAAWEGVPLNMSGPLRVVHRDLKPSNIMVSRQAEVKVLDFGTARFDFAERQARTGAMRFGSLKYMSPERRQGDRGDHASDVYALGLVAIELLRGELLPVLPVDAHEHDGLLTDVIQRLDDLGLPDERWDDALRQTLAGMVGADPARRLHASQLVPLFRSFADAATGESLDAFSAGTIADLTQHVYGGRPEGELSGSRVFMALTTSADGPPPSTDTGTRPREDAPAGHDELPEDPGWGDVDRPTQVSVSITDQDRPTQSIDADEFERPTEVGGLPPARTDGGTPLPVHAAPPAGFPVHDSTTRSRTAVATGPVAAPARAATPPAKAPRSELMTGIIAGAVVFVLGGVLIAFAASALGMWWYFGGGGSPTASSPSAPVVDLGLAEAAGDTPTASTAGGGDTVALTLASDDDMLQWLAIEDDAGARLFKGEPGGTADLPAGDYQLVAKVRARSKAQAPLSLDGPLQLRCASADDGEVHCTGDRDLVLKP
ncbi:MAG: serine/threonine protein kinase [Alphaproteobacteria bacterium]|nr:serine/threonine protein kinase [Alphaproteobacteria bacterium]